MSQHIVIHCQPSLRDFLYKNDFYYVYNDNEIDVLVDDVPYTVTDGIYQDPDEQLCEHYGINYDEVNCIEAL